MGTIDNDQTGQTITNSVDAATSDTPPDPTTDGDDLTESFVVVPPNPSLSMTKVANDEGPYTVGDVITIPIRSQMTAIRLFEM